MSVKVFIVDDSAVVRQVLTELLGSDPGIEVIGSAVDPLFALKKIESNWPDVIVLDVEMPRMDGISFLRKLMKERPTPVVICSTLTEKGAQTTIDAMQAGAVAILTKPKIGLKDFLQETVSEFTSTVKGAAKANMRTAASHAAPAPATVSASAAVERPLPGSGAPHQAMSRTTQQVVAIGTSTGGTQALEKVLTALPAVCPSIVVVQHMPEHFTAAFANRLNQICACEVKEAANGDRVVPGRVLIAPGGLHMQLRRSGAQYGVEVRDGPPVNRHRPSVDVLFRSVAKVAGVNALGVIMTGMGDDGARGLLEMREAGAHTVGQDEATCVVYGMPKEAYKRGGVVQQMPLHGIAAMIMRYVHGG